VACSQPESFSVAEGQDGGSSNSLVPDLVGDGAAGATDQADATSGPGAPDGAAGAPTMVSADDASTDGTDPDGAASSDDGAAGAIGEDAGADAAPDGVAAGADGSMDVSLAQEVGPNDAAAPSAGDVRDAGDADASIPDAGTEVPASPAALCINAGGPTVDPCLADVGYTGGSARYHPGAVDLSRVTDPAPAAVYETARVGTFSYAVPGFAPGSAHLVRLHFVETSVNSKGQRLCDVTSGAVAVLTRFDIFAAAGGANVVTIQERRLTADASGRINLGFARASGSSSCLVSAIEVR
jgi:hypothetical protein